MSGELTVRQTQVLAFMRKFFEMNDQLPTNKAIADAFGFASTNAADEHQRALEARGALVRNELGNRMFAGEVKFGDGVGLSVGGWTA